MISFVNWQRGESIRYFCDFQISLQLQTIWPIIRDIVIFAVGINILLVAHLTNKKAAEAILVSGRVDK